MRHSIVILTTLFACTARAELTIFDTRKNLPLSNTEKVLHDYYVDSGSESGLKQGMVLTVSRQVPMYDYYRSRSVGDVRLKIAKVKVIQVQDGLAVVRLREEVSREEAALPDDEFIMIGDRLDLGTVVAEAAPVMTPTEEVAVTPAPSSAAAPAPAGRIVVNSVDLTIDPAPTERAPAAAPAATPATK